MPVDLSKRPVPSDPNGHKGLKPNGKRWSPKFEYEHEYCDVVVDLMAEGKTYVEVAATIGVSLRTFESWRKSVPEFDEACVFGAALAEKWYQELGRRHLVNERLPDGTTTIFDTRQFIYTMKWRFKHYDKERDIVVNTQDLSQLGDLMDKMTKDMHKDTI